MPVPFFPGFIPQLRRLPPACELLKMPDRVRRSEYRRMVLEGLARGERSVSYSRWLTVLRRACKLAMSDPGGNIQL